MTKRQFSYPQRDDSGWKDLDGKLEELEKGFCDFQNSIKSTTSTLASEKADNLWAIPPSQTDPMKSNWSIVDTFWKGVLDSSTEQVEEQRKANEELISRLPWKHKLLKHFVNVFNHLWRRRS